MNSTTVQLGNCTHTITHTVTLPQHQIRRLSSLHPRTHAKDQDPAKVRESRSRRRERGDAKAARYLAVNV